MRIAFLLDQYPALSETFVANEIAAFRGLGHDVEVHTAAWAQPRGGGVPGVRVACLDDDGRLRRLLDLAWLVAHRPRGCVADLRARAAWRREEPVRPLRVIAPLARRLAARRIEHVHVHFAAGAALDALRLQRLLGLPYSVVAHAYDIYREPRNLAAKLREATVAAGVSEYSVADLRAIAGPAHADRVHVVVMGVDHERFQRRRPYPGGRSVLAIGRLVEKKGFGPLLQAVARAPVDRLVVVGDGPLRAELAALARDLGIDDRVSWRGALGIDEVREALEDADVLAMTAVPVADGDRDVLPVVVGEALSMEIPVVASDFVGLPEVVREPWGRLVPPGDVEAIAAALTEVLELPPEDRIAMGRAGRAFVVAERDLTAAAQRMTALIVATRDQSTSVR